MYVFVDECDFLPGPSSIVHEGSSVFPACDIFWFRDGSRVFVEVLQCYRTVNKQIHTL